MTVCYGLLTCSGIDLFIISGLVLIGIIYTIYNLIKKEDTLLNLSLFFALLPLTVPLHLLIILDIDNLLTPLILIIIFVILAIIFLMKGKIKNPEKKGKFVFSVVLIGLDLILIFLGYRSLP